MGHRSLHRIAVASRDATGYPCPSLSGPVLVTTDSNILFSWSEREEERSLEYDLAILGCEIRLKNMVYRFGEVVAGALEGQGMTMVLVRNKQVFPWTLLHQKDIGFD